MSAIQEEVVVPRLRQRYLWRAVDQDGDVVDVLLQERRDAASARRFFRRLCVMRQGCGDLPAIQQRETAAAQS
jgi:transposase-like protein